MKKLSVAGNKVLQDDSELLYMTMIGMVVAAIFAAGLHEDVDRTVTRLAPVGSFYPFPAQTRLPAAKFTAALGGFFVGIFFWTVMGKLRWSTIKLLLQYRDWLKYSRTTKTKAWYFMLSNLLPRKKFLYTFQHVLPRYPLPSLKTTCQKMLTTIEPLVDEQRFQLIKDDMKEFEESDGIKLQKVLQSRYESELNWVADLWDKHAYLSARTPLYYTNFCNQGGLMKTDISLVSPQSMCSRAAALTYYYMKFYKLIEARTVNPLLVNDLVPICTYRYRYVFACTRQPGSVIDEMKTYEKIKHIIVIRKGVMFRLDIIAMDSHGEESILSGPELKRILEGVVEETAGMSNTEWNPAVFTTQNRNLWAQEREKLLSHPLNKVSLHDVESAAFHLVLEDSSPEGLTAECASNLCGNGYNRWFDKSLTVSVYENGVAGGNVEHTTADATLTSRLLEYVWGESKYDSNGEPLTPDALSHPDLPSPVRIKWDLTQFKADIPMYLQHFETTFKHNIDVHAMKLKQGKGAIKKLRVSPDSFVQMALQLAFYRMHKFVPKTYESAMTRFFKYGRTETIRTVSKHSVAFTKAMDDSSTCKADTIKYLKQAMAYHHNYKLDAMNGQAADRHMFGLFVASKMVGSKPKLFEHKILTEFDHLSTSQSPFFYDKELADRMDLYPAGGAFAALREDGYGVYYLFLGDNFLTVHITSYKSCSTTSSQLFGKQLVQAMDDIKQLLQ